MKKNKRKKPLDSYLDTYAFGTGISSGNQVFDVASDALMNMTKSSVMGLMSTLQGKNTHPDIFSFTENTNPTFAMGGISNANAEVEGGEIAETPQGELVGFEGDNHEQGGIDVELPEGTKIFSKRLKKAGNTMAKRKLIRERKIKKLEKLLANKPHDAILKSTLEKTIEANAIEEQGDMMIQESMNTLDKATQAFMYGGMMKKKYQNGTPITGIDDEDSIMNILMGASQGFENINGELVNKALPQPVLDQVIDNQINTPNLEVSQETLDLETPNKNKLETNPVSTIDSTGIKLNTDNIYGELDTDPIKTLSTQGIQFPMDESAMDLSDTPKVPSTDIESDQNKNPFEGYDFTPGDLTGMIGTGISGFGPLMTTIANRIGDTPNENFFKDYGKAGLDNIQKTKGLVGQLKNKAERDLSLKEASNRKRARGSARGLNTLRALDQVYDAQTQKTIGDIYSNYANQMMGILGQETSLLNQRDQIVAEGETQRDLADRKDRDQFFTNLSRNLSNLGVATQKVGKDLNIKQADIDFKKLLPALSRYGIGIDKDAKGDYYFMDQAGNRQKINFE